MKKRSKGKVIFKNIVRSKSNIENWMAILQINVF